MDALSDVLRSVRLAGGVFLDSLFTAPWCVRTNVQPEDCRPYLAAPSQMIAYHFILDGRLLASVADEPPIEIAAGEIVLLPRNDVHMLASGRGVTPVSGRELVRPSLDGGLPGIRYGGGGATTRVVCGFLGTEEPCNPLISTLPRILKLDVREGTSRDWIEASMRFAGDELAGGRLASAGMMSRLSELLLIEAVRQYSATLPDGAVGWLMGLRDPQIGRALALVHGDLAAPWSAESLAKEVAMSRSAFVDRFASLVGTPPIRYLTVWRLQTAKLMLRESRKTIAQLAYAVGYESEEAFSRAFKREFGLPPGRWREQQPA
ncbi:MAG: AraC family transcriptional regulator [Hyphomicrobiales bacterium]|nr:AraC family transcriptional regulator [Hyphomicrobiales bacterium]